MNVNAPAILTLIGDLYAANAALSERIRELEATAAKEGQSAEPSD